MEAQTFAAIGVLSAAFASDPSAPVVPWGTVLNGSDDVSKIGRLFGDTIDDGPVPGASVSTGRDKAVAERPTGSASMASAWAIRRAFATARLPATELAMAAGACPVDTSPASGDCTTRRPR